MSDKKHPKKNGPEAAAPSSTGEPGSPMDVALLQQLVQLMKANDLSSVELRDGHRRITLRRGGEQPAMTAVAHQPIQLMPSAAPAPQSSAPPAPTPGAAATTDAEAGLQQIKSPMVGTFYAAPSPDAKPFVSVGSQVDEDTDVCVIEAMKVFNNIKAEARGTIAKVLVTNGQPVEFGQTLFFVKPA